MTMFAICFGTFYLQICVGKGRCDGSTSAPCDVTKVRPRSVLLLEFVISMINFNSDLKRNSIHWLKTLEIIEWIYLKFTKTYISYVWSVVNVLMLKGYLPDMFQPSLQFVVSAGIRFLRGMKD